MIRLFFLLFLLLLLWIKIKNKEGGTGEQEQEQEQEQELEQEQEKQINLSAFFLGQPSKKIEDSLMSSPSLRLNVFQRLMLQWKEVAPYNAGTLLHLSGPPNVARWETSIRQLVSEIGLGRPLLTGPDQVTFVPIPSITLRQTETLETTTAEELNHPYDPQELPLRFFICPGEDQSHWLGFMFDHWLTDGGTLAELVVRLVVRYAEPEAPIGYPAHTLNNSTLPELFGDKIPAFHQAEPFREAARVRSEHRDVTRFTDQATASFTTHFYQQKWPTELPEHLQSRAKAWGVSVHDVLLAAVAQLLSGEGQDLSLASVMDIRSEAQQPIEGRLGQFISFYTNVVEQPHQFSLEHLARQLGEKNRRLKQEGRALKNLAALEAARQAWEKAGSLAEKSNQFHRLAPITAGVSHMKVTRLQREIGRAISRHRGLSRGYRESSPLLDATVVSPTGPLTPLLITVNRLNPHSTMMGISYRTSLYTRPQIVTLARELIRRLSS